MAAVKGTVSINRIVISIPHWPVAERQRVMMRIIPSRLNRLFFNSIQQYTHRRKVNKSI